MANAWPKVALIGEHSEYRLLLVEVARRLKAKGTVVHWYCATEEERDYYQSRFGDLFDSITVANRLYKAALSPVRDFDSEIAKARRNEERLGTTYNTLAVADRHLGRGYALAGHRHPRSEVSEKADYSSLLHAYNELIDFWEGEIATKGPDLIINGGKAAALIGRLHDIPYRKLASSRFKNLHYWAVDEFYENPEFEETFIEHQKEVPTETLETPYQAHLQTRAVLSSTLSLPGTMKEIGLAVARHVYWRLRGYEKARGYMLGETLGFLWRRHADLKKLMPLTVPLSAIESRPFVYYPLHTEPEAALQALSPEYFYQLSSIAALSRDLPAGTVLAVKETIAALGRRPQDFYSQLADFKNVVLLDPTEYGLQVARKASAVATITGSGGFEGAAMGKPVVSFGKHNIYNFLDHVKVIHDERTLKGILDYCLSSSFDRHKAEEDGRRLLDAIKVASIDLGNFNVMAPDLVEDDVIAALVEKLVGGISRVSPAAALLQNDSMEQAAG